MNRFRTLLLLAGVLLSVAGCSNPVRDRTKLEFERLRERPTSSDEEKILPDFGADPWTEEALRLPPRSGLGRAEL
jgi:hypothetical protein